ncbi:MAG: cytochrome P450 [Pseudomonadota bacterium]
MPEPSDLPRVHKRPPEQSDHDYIRDLAAQGPVAVDRYGFYWTFSHAHLLRCTDPNLTRQVETDKVIALGITEGPVFEYFANSLLFSNGAQHTRRRRPLARTFAFKLMDGMRPRIREIVVDLIRTQPAEEVDFLDQIAGPLPALIVAEVLGVPAAEVPRFTALVYPAMRALSLRPSQSTEVEQAALAELDDFIVTLLEDRIRTPREDFLSDFTSATSGDLTDVEMRVQISSVILAGSDTTRMALCSTLSQLLQHPKQWSAFCADPDELMAGVAAEGLRFDPVIGSLPRVATIDFDLDGVAIPAGSVLTPIVPAALRDPAVYELADSFDIHRTDHPRHHPVFGAGAHRCLGEALARAELEEALATLARLAPQVTLVGQPPVLRGVSGARTIDQMRV